MKKENIQGSTVSPPGFSATQTSEGGISPLLSVFRAKWMAWIVLLASLVVTFFAWYLARGAVLQSANDRFVFRGQTIALALRDRLHACAFLLETGAGLFAGSEKVTRAEWRTYVAALHIDKHYQGVQGLGFSKRILPAEKKAHIRQIRAEGFPNYKVHPDGERPEYTSIIFLEPFDWRNQRAFGYDMFSEPTRKAAMEMARDTGSVAVSGKITLLQETEKDVQAGFLMYLPVYRNGEVAETPEQRREALTGYVYIPHRMNDFMQGLLIEKREDVELQVFDGDEPLKETLLYPRGSMESLLSHPDHVHFATYQSLLEYAGRRWLLVFKSSPYFEETINTGQVNSILLLGITISLLLFAVVMSLTRSRNQALSLANMTLDLEKANVGLMRENRERKQGEEIIRQLNDALEGKVRARTQQLVESQEKLEASVAENRQALEYANTLTRSSPDGVIAVDTDLRITEWNLLMEQMCGKSREQEIGQDLAEIPFMKETGEGARVRAGLEGKSIGPREVAYRIPGEDTERFFESIMAPLREPTGKILGAVLRVRDITERKRMANELIESEHGMRTILESVQAGIVIIDPEKHRIVDVNSFAARMIGMPKESIIGSECHKSICPAEGDQCPFTDLHQTIDNSERVLLTASGERREILKTVTSIQLGGRSHLLESFIDITERKQAQQALSDSEELLRTIFDSVQDGIIVADAQTRQFKMVNASICRMLGYSADEILELGVEGIHPAQELAYVSSQFELQAKGEIRVAPALPMQRKDGSIFYADVNAGPMMINGVASLVGVFRDITERMRAEEQQRLALLYARSLIEADMDPLVTINVAGKIMDVNEAAIQMTGVPRELMTGSDFSDYFTEPDRAHAGYQEAFATGFVRDYPLTMRHVSGGLTEVLYNASVYRNEKGEMAGVLAVARDITERLRAEQAEELASRDGLTGLYNHRTFYALLKDEIFRTQRSNRPLSLLMLDIDYFKHVNDTHGHQAGDVILRDISDLLLKQARAVDRVCRYGGEEIAVILPETDANEAMKIAERLCAAVELQSFDIGDGKTVGITVSIGVATYLQQANSLEALVKAADVALYAAKQGGRNRVCDFGTDTAVKGVGQ